MVLKENGNLKDSRWNGDGRKMIKIERKRDLYKSFFQRTDMTIPKRKETEDNQHHIEHNTNKFEQYVLYQN